MDALFEYLLGIVCIALGLAILSLVGYLLIRAYREDSSRKTMRIRVAGGFIGWICAAFLLWQGITIVLSL